MREILFRGQTRRKREKVTMAGNPIDSNWVYGGVLQGAGDFSIIYQTEPEIKKFLVYSDTIGQYIGLTDKHGNRIFEGDICKAYGYVAGSLYGAIIWRNEAWCLDVDRHGAVRIALFNAFEVVGNIHDNPEMVEKAK